MMITANQTYRVTRAATINARKGQVMPGGLIRTLTLPEDHDGVDTIMVRYSGHDAHGEAQSGTKFRIQVPALAQIARLVN